MNYNYIKFKQDFVDGSSTQAILDYVKQNEPVKEEHIIEIISLFKASKRNQNKKRGEQRSQGYPAKIRQTIKYFIKIGCFKKTGNKLEINKDFIPFNQKG